MSSKKQIAEQALRILSGGHIKPDRTLDIRELMLSLDQARDARMRIDTLNNIKNGEYSVNSDYLSFYSSETVALTVEGVRSCVLPAATVSLYGGLEIYQITPEDELEAPYIILKPGEVGMFAGTSALEHEDKVFVWKAGNSLFFKNLDVAVTDVTMMLAISGKEIAEDADYPVPPDVEDELLKMLIETFGVMQQIPHDNLEDGVK